ncbi:protein SIEVE ELEMENT OCCLUSION A-like isoform X1 [Macadamia integrifolia]|uniref:protein SIEVE ELEMENT OCCLUSION A-like isoform X1 n=1 Tax=Macadamia integrifolia TaxID=60698 RepID=UPI001C527AF5|nr:protein SIEVE ELEMENT OCCLUSION A-like isoform X1 [Macadamia integrifolia]
MISRCACGVDDAHEVTVALLDSLHDYSWAAQIVLLVAAFAISFGEFWQTVEPPLTAEEDHLSRSICLLKRPHCLIQATDSVKSGLESMRTLVERIWELTKWLVEFEKEFATSWYATYKKSNAAIEYPEVLVIGYQVVYSVVTCLFHDIALVRMNKEYTTLATEFQQMRKSSETLAFLQSYIYARRRMYAIGLHAQYMIDTGPSYLNILKFMSGLISQTGELVLSHATKGKETFFTKIKKLQVTLEKLTGKCIALFISDFKVQKEEFPSLIKTYKAASNNPNTCFEVVWVPMVDQSTTWTEDNKRTVSNMGTSMPWYWVSDPSTIKISFLQHVKEEWHFQGKPILVILDMGAGQIKHTNALPMMEFWGPSAYPFSIKDEERLQEGLSRAIDLMFSTNEPNMDKWVEEGKIICFYGSHNEEWIRKFLHKLENITTQTNLKMEITYVGTNKKEEELSRILAIIKDMNKSRVWPEERILSFWHTWKKIRGPKKIYFSMWKEIINILSYDEYEDGWALIFQDSKQEVVKSSGTKLIECLDSFVTRGSRIEEPKNFLKELNEELRVKYDTEHCCSGMKVPTSDGSVQVHCMECGRFMD